MSQAITSHHSHPSDAWSVALALQRRVCVLQHQGRAAEAEALSIAKLSPALEALKQRQPERSDEITHRLEAEILRVAEAAIMAGLIADLLPSRLDPGAAAPAVTRPAARQQASIRRRENPGEENPVTGFIDEMLAARTTGRKS